MEKDDFIRFVVQIIQLHPDWFGDMILATQLAVINRLEEESNKVALLAYTLVQYVDKDKRKNHHSMQGGLRALANFFHGAEIEKKIRSFIEEE